ncbi:Membrane bound FAD containing D-sorbitol dehydrogenase [Roseovarius nanhaiticus]|uniref:Membrane bound FAD containing D-sorbitol dehydrogenase n=2 Tax=Roseovarius nanhaiticus TaxID=573024 RepID=A0A1N7FTS6_9RHOB|nr:Membrane bound FAD containing D-sorbitol dehydrogenase [Roseovarius nanhaiticus]SIS03657.1 Membrane bound FAD containing D-sorbitol dehydrogenase [Roseovarius nanhaiticus]
MPNSNSAQQASMTRRSLLCAASSLPVLALAQWPARALAAEFDVGAFLRLSQELTARDALSESIGADLLKAFAATDRAADLAALADGAEDDDLANAVVASWYSGISPDPEDTQVASYTEALMWDAMDFTKPQGMCGGGMGYWNDAPDA